MDTLTQLIKELNSLPLGNIYQKTINGKIYHYHQYFYNGQRITKIINEVNLDDLKNKIERRKIIEKQIKSIRLHNSSLSNKIFELTGYVMNENVVVAKFEKGTLVDINDSLAPLIISRTHSIEKFLKLRILDMSRTNARILKKVLNINVDEDYKASLFAYALSISDRYWFKPKHSKLKYHDVKFDNDALFETALKGETNVFFQKAKLSPEITTTGSFEKGWRYINNEWWLYKIGNKEQYFSELFCTEFADLIGINTVKYEYIDGYIRCKNFSPEYNFEPMASLADNNDNYEYVFNILYKINKKIAKDYLKLIFFDSVVNNIDRHNENYGLLRNIKTGKIISLAPNFDNNLALIATTETLNRHMQKDGFMKLFINFISKNEVAKKLFLDINLKEINEEDIDNILDSIPIKIADSNNLEETILLRYNYLKDYFNNKHISKVC